MSANICNICGANLIYKDGKWVCPACGAFKTEEISNEEVTLLYNAAQKLRLASFDDAEEAYRDIIAKYPENSEAHWGLVLSKYGIKYEDDYDGKKLPTCYATSIESVLTDKDYLDAVRLCKDKYQKEYYIEQGKVLEKIRVEWLEKASKEPKYDVFLCFKDSDKLNNMERTDDSIEVANLYTHLSSLGYKVFYSRESLRDKVAEKYEPYIYNALNTAAVMIVYGSKIEYFSSVWMKNEWTRYVRRLREGLKIEGSLVIACDGVNPGDLPRPLNQMQVLDARKKTFYGDLETHIAKIISIARRPKATVERVEISSAIGKKKASIDNQIKTIKVGGGVGKKTPVVIDNAVSVREIGRYEVPALTPDEDTKLKSVNLFLQKELFDNAKKVVDEILEKNKYNGQALLADLLIRYKVKSIDELSDKIEEIEDFSQFNTVIEYSDKNVGEKLIAVIGQKIRLAVANSNYDVAIACLKEIVVYNSAEVLNIRLELRKTATRLLAVSANTAAEIFDVLVNSYQDSETYIEYIQGFVDDCIKNRQFTVAQKYNDKITELDDGNLKATFSQAYIYVQATSFDSFITLADRFVDFKLFDNAIKHFDEEDTVECFARFRKIVVGLIVGQKSGNAIADWFDFVVKYEFDGRNEFIEETINSLPDIKDLTDRAKLFDRAIMCIDGSDVERHIFMRLSFAKKLQAAGNFALANKYYNEVIEIEEGNLDALWGIILCNIGALRETDIAQNIENFSYFKELETLLKYCPDMGIRAEYLDKLVNAVLFKSASICNEESINKLAKIFDGIIKYYPEECNEILIKYLQKFADNCKNSSAFSLAEKYYAMVLAIDNMKHEAYWGLLQAKLNCRNNDDLIKQKKTISEFSEFSSAIAAASNDERSADKYASIAKNQLDYWADYEKRRIIKRNKKKKALTAFAILAVVLMIASVIVSAIQYVKIESGLKYEESVGGVIVTAGKFYHENKVEIPSTYDGKKVVGIGDGAFNNNEDIISVSLPISIKNIGQNAFRNCRNLKTVDFRNCRNNVGIGDHAFSGCTSLESINLEYADTIGEGAFKGCEMLGQAVLNDDIICLPKDAFNGCLRLKNIVLPANLSKIDERCFSGCQNLKVITIPESVETIGSNVFDGCIGLVRIILEYREGDLSGFSDMWLSGVPAATIVNVGFRITLDYNGATDNVLENKTIVSVGESFILPVPARIGYKFVGWYDGKKDANKFTDEKGMSLVEYDRYESVTVYAIWEANLNEIVFNANGGEGEMNNQKVATDATFALNECLYTKKGYTFAGWGTTANGEVNYSDKAEYMMGTNAQYVLYAIWTPNNNTLHFESNGGSGKMPDITIATDAKGTLSANVFTKTGYDFVGWAEAENGSKVYSDGDSYTMGTENATLYALWTPKTYKITYNLNGGQTAVKNKNTYTIETATFTLNNPTQRGYEFKGWSGSNLIGNENKTVSIETGVYGELTFTANWTAIDYSITYNLEGGINNSANPTTYTVEQELHLLDPEKEGYKFNGWTDNGIISKGSIGKKTFTAIWEIINYDIIYNLDGGTNNSSNPNDYNINTPDIILKAPTKLGYRFIEWSNGGIIKNGSTEEKSFTAKWEIITYTITYDLDGGTNNKNNPETYNANDSITLIAPFKPGYEFEGWTDNGIIPINSTGDRVFVASWKIINYKINYDLRGGTNNSSNPDNYNINTPDIILKAPTKLGYRFIEWSNSGMIENGSVGEKSFTAKWELEIYSITYNLDGGTNSKYNPTTYNVYSNIELADPSKLGYEFMGWTHNGIIPINSTGDKVFTASWKVIDYKINYDLGGGTNDKQNKGTYNIEDEEIVLASPTRTGYTFNGWTDEGKIPPHSTGDKTFIANWTAIEYSISYNLNNGINSADNPETYTIEQEICLKDPDRRGYKFIGWTDNGTIPINSTGDKVFTANWTIIDYTISYYLEGGQNDKQNKSTYNVEDEEIILAAPTRKGYTFNGWTNEGRIPAHSTGDKTFFASWTAIEYSIIYILNDGTNNADNPETYTIEQEIRLKAPDRYGYNFIGWTYSGTIPKGSIGEKTFTASWRVINYKISYDLGGGSNNKQNKSTYNIEDEEIILAAPTRPGYTFNGWTNEGTIPAHSTGDREFVASWTANKNTLKFNANGGNGGEMPDVTLSTDEEYKLPKNALTRYGYTFAGWSTEADGTVEFEDESVYTMGADSEVTLYAIWSPITYKITYELNGGKAENITEYSIETGEFSLSAPTRAGYTFTGWSGSNLMGGDNLTVTIADGTYGALSFVAHWQANENMLVFDANGGVGSMESQKGFTDSTLILNANIFTRKGYDFDGWSTIKNGEKQYADESVYVMGTSSTNTLYAVWTPHLNTLILDGNGSTSGAMNNMDIHSGETKALDKNTYEKQGYTFIGWAETANGNVVYTDCANYVMGVEPTVILYAVWKANEYTISMNPQNDSSVTTQKVTYDESYTLSVPTRAGYTFDGWFTEVGGNGTRLTDADGNSIANWTVADNITVYAKWLGTEGLVYSANGSEYLVSGVSDKTITEAYIPEYYNGKLVTAIGENAFSGCDKLTAVFMENTIETIGKGAFSECSALTRLVVPFVGESRTATQEKGLLTYWFGQDSAENTEEIYQFYLDDKGSQNYWAYVPLSLNYIKVFDTTRIPYGAFSYMSKLQNVSFDGVSEIEERAFEYATGISTFDLPDTLKSIGANAFAHTSIKDITIPSSVQSIGEGIFAGCKALAEMKIPFVGQSAEATEYNAVLGWLFGQNNYDGMTATTQGSWTSYISAALKTVEITNASTVPEYAFANIKTLKNVVLANTITKIKDNAFRGCTGLTNIDLHLISTIGGSAFYECSGLTSVNLESATSIGSNAFFKAYSLESVDFSDNLTTIGGSAFYACKIGKIEIPSSIVSIGSYAFEANGVLRTIIIRKESAMLPYSTDMLKGFNNYAKIYVPDGLLASYKSNSSWKALGVDKFYGLSIVKSNGMAISGNTLVQYFGTDESVTIPSSITNILPYAFYRNTFVRRIVIPGTITTITDHAFYGCDNLETVKLMRGTTQISSYAFAENALLQSINLPDTLVNIGAYSFMNAAFTDIVVPNSVTSIGAGAFQGCPLESITLPFVGGSKTSTGSSAVFGYIFGYNSVQIDKTSTYVNGHVEERFGSQPASTVWQYSEYVYSNTSSSYRYYYPTSYYYYIPSTLTTVVISDAMVIPEEAFFNCENITSVTLNNGVEVIGTNAFKNCTALQSMSLPSSVTEVGSYAFYGCSNMASITLSNLTKINGYTFQGCSSLDGVVLPETLTEICNYAFSGCVGLTGITIPNTVTRIGQSAFSGCTGITKLTLPNGLQTIGQEAFKNMQLQSIVVPNSVTSIGVGAFQGCPLKSITLPFVGGSKTSTGSSAVFGYIFGYESVRIDTTSAYVNGHVDKSFGSQPASTVWQYSEYVYSSTSSYGTRYYYPTSYYYYIPSTLTTVVIADATVIPEEAFYNCVNITNVTLNNGIETIGANAFKNCTALQSISLPSSVAEVGRYAFYGCSNMANITLSNLTKISDYMFDGCSSLDGVVLPETLTEIGNYAFSGCVGLTGITIPTAVTSIGQSVFSGCAGITELTLPNGLQTIGQEAFKNMQLQSIVVPNSVTSIGASAFQGCSYLKIVHITNGDVTNLTALGKDAFSGAHSSLCIIVPQDALKAYKEATNWSSYASKIFAENNIVDNSYLVVDGVVKQYIGDDETVTIPANITAIGNYAFAYSNVKSVTVGNDVTTIGQYAFAYCVGLQTVTIGDSVTSIGDYAFYNCQKLETVVYGSGLSAIGNYAFAECSELSKINSADNGVFNLNGSLKKIATRAFYNNANATKIIVGKSVETIESAAFMGCNNLVSIELPFIGMDRSSTYSQWQVFGYIFGYEMSNKEGTTMQYTNYYYYIPASLREVVITDETVVSKNAFINCSMIESIIIKSDLTSIGDYAFYNCGGFKTITIESNTMPTISAYVFNGDSTVVIKVNSVILSDYQSDANWSKRTLEAIQ